MFFYTVQSANDMFGHPSSQLTDWDSCESVIAMKSDWLEKAEWWKTCLLMWYPYSSWFKEGKQGI